MLPVILPFGIVSIYGVGTSTGSGWNIVAPQGYLWGTVDDVYDGGAIFVYNGDNLLFREDEVVCRLAWDNATYTLLKLNKDFILKEELAP